MNGIENDDLPIKKLRFVELVGRELIVEPIMRQQNWDQVGPNFCNESVEALHAHTKKISMEASNVTIHKQNLNEIVSDFIASRLKFPLGGIVERLKLENPIKEKFEIMHKLNYKKTSFIGEKYSSMRESPDYQELHTLMAKLKAFEISIDPRLESASEKKEIKNYFERVKLSVDEYAIQLDTLEGENPTTALLEKLQRMEQKHTFDLFFEEGIRSKLKKSEQIAIEKNIEAFVQDTQSSIDEWNGQLGHLNASPSLIDKDSVASPLENEIDYFIDFLSIGHMWFIVLLFRLFFILKNIDFF